VAAAAVLAAVGTGCAGDEGGVAGFFAFADVPVGAGVWGVAAAGTGVEGAGDPVTAGLD